MKTLRYALLVSTVALSACSSPQDVSEQNFADAMSAYLNKHGQLCLDATAWPVDLGQTDMERMMDFAPLGRGLRMEALAAAGLVSGTLVEVYGAQRLGLPVGPTRQAMRYTLTEQGQPFLQARPTTEYSTSGVPSPAQVTDLCFGRKVLDRIVKWTEPGARNEVVVSYTYRIDALAEWASSPKMHEAYPGMGDLIAKAGQGVERHRLALSNEGWQARGMD